MANIRVLIARLQDALETHVISAWFPRCLDREFGGFLSGFSREWHPEGAQDKLLEFQARQTWFAAEALLADPDNDLLREAVEHGYRFLMERMWDPVHGGWYHQTARDGRPQLNGAKHAHGIAYAIPACLAVHAATGDPEASAAAWAGFRWLDAHSYDPEHGGYCGPMRRDGSVVHQRDAGDGTVGDAIGTLWGHKDVNVHGDLLETFVYLCSARTEPTAEKRLDELLDVLLHRFRSRDGALLYQLQRDWQQPPANHVVVGYQFQLANRLHAAMALRPGRRDELLAAAQTSVDFAVRYGYDRHKGGYYFAVDWKAPEQVVEPSKHWWPPMDALLSFVYLSRRDTRHPDDLRLAARTWREVQAGLVDRKYGGFFWRQEDRPLRAFLRLLGIRGRRSVRKGDEWKDASHEGRALLRCLHVLNSEVSQAYPLFKFRATPQVDATDSGMPVSDGIRGA